MSYHQFQDVEGDKYGQPYGSCEVFQREDGTWWWWACFPGCMPDSEEPSGPFDTKEEALEDAGAA